MPAKSKKMRRAMAIAEHHPEKLYRKNREMLKMSKAQLHDFATTPEKKLPNMVKKSVRGSGAFSSAELAKGYRSLGKGFPHPMDGKPHSTDNRGEGTA